MLQGMFLNSVLPHEKYRAVIGQVQVLMMKYFTI
jgi:hypothetical protein